MTYLLIFATAFILTLTATPLSAQLGRRLGLTDRPDERRTHRGEVPRLGGIALFIGFAGAGALVFGLSATGVWPPVGSEDHKLLAGVMLGSGLIFAFGLWDDYHELSAWPQLGAQVGAALLACVFDVIIERVTLPIFGPTIFPPWITYPLTIFWIVGMINTVNWLDGLDGLAGGVTTIAGLFFAVHAYSLGQNVVALFPLALAGACLGFLPFNFHPARIFMGSSGSMLLGFALASLSIVAPAKVATALLVLGLPILDVAWLILWRWRRWGSPTVAGRDHLHHRLLDLGLSQRQIVALYYSFCVLFGMLALLIEARLVKLAALAVMSSLTLGVLWRLSRVQK
jgi:UDP-GlcNAc:undecaprenyl-phosphate GlcNAc-1-phosphate transferase